MQACGAGFPIPYSLSPRPHPLTPRPPRLLAPPPIPATRRSASSLRPARGQRSATVGAPHKTLQWKVGTTAQVRQLTAFVFGEGGRGWNNGEHFDDRPKRQDAGIGLELRINVLRLAEFPIRMDVAYPLHDPEYRKPQFILFGVLNF